MFQKEDIFRRGLFLSQMHSKEKLQFLESIRPTKIMMVMHPLKRLLKVFLNKSKYPSIFENFRIPNWVPEEVEVTQTSDQSSEDPNPGDQQLIVEPPSGLEEEMEAEESEKSDIDQQSKLEAAQFNPMQKAKLLRISMQKEQLREMQDVFFYFFNRQIINQICFSMSDIFRPGSIYF